MYLFLAQKSQNIDGVDFIKVHLLYCDESCDNFSVTRVYVKKTEDIEQTLSLFNKFDDVSNYIVSKVRHDGKVVLTFK